MTISDWVYVGVKLLAVYFAVVGAVAAAVVTVGLLTQGFFAVVQTAHNPPPVSALPTYYNLFDFVQPGCFLLASWFLARNTGIVFRLLRVHAPDDGADTTPAATAHETRED